jgi:hypothetical protein
VKLKGKKTKRKEEKKTPNTITMNSFCGCDYKNLATPLGILLITKLMAHTTPRPT